MGMVEKTVQVISLMNAAEREQVFAGLAEKGLLPIQEARTIPSDATAKPAKGRRRRTGKRPFWLKKIDSWNDRKMGGYGIEGSMVWTAADVTGGTVLALCINDGDERRAYGLVEVRHGSTFVYEGEAVSVTVDDVAIHSGPFDTWDEFKATAKAHGLGI